jgi:hypothetical protein
MPDFRFFHFLRQLGSATPVNYLVVGFAAPRKLASQATEKFPGPNAPLPARQLIAFFELK